MVYTMYLTFAMSMYHSLNMVFQGTSKNTLVKQWHRSKKFGHSIANQTSRLLLLHWIHSICKTKPSASIKVIYLKPQLSIAFSVLLKVKWDLRLLYLKKAVDNRSERKLMSCRPLPHSWLTGRFLSSPSLNVFTAHNKDEMWGILGLGISITLSLSGSTNKPRLQFLLSNQMVCRQENKDTQTVYDIIQETHTCSFPEAFLSYTKPRP